MTVQQGAGQQTINGAATNVSAGTEACESGQSLTFLVGSNNSALFAVQPAISPAGTLTFTPSAPGSATGQAIVSVVLQDNGGTANGDVNTSLAQTFVISVSGRSWRWEGGGGGGGGAGVMHTRNPSNWQGIGWQGLNFDHSHHLNAN